MCTSVHVFCASHHQIVGLIVALQLQRYIFFLILPNVEPTIFDTGIKKFFSGISRILYKLQKRQILGLLGVIFE